MFFQLFRSLAPRRHAIRRLACIGAAALAPLMPALSATAEATNDPLPVGPGVIARLDRAVTDATSGLGSAEAVSVAIIEDGTIVYARAAGFATANGTAATTATRFRAGSVSKIFTAVAILQLVESKRIALDDTLATYLPSAPHASEITLRQLLTHTSGLPDYLDSAISSGAAASPTTPQGILNLVAASPLEFVPGRRYGYSNTNYVLLGLVVEKVTGMPLAAYERDRVLTPAGMTETTFGAAPAGAPLATGFMDAEGTPAGAIDPSWLYACGDVLTTARDLARFDIALLAGRLVTAETFARMATSGVAVSGDGRGYGLGLTLRPFGNDRLVGHHGGLPGFEAVDEMIPEKRFGVVVLGNSYRFDTARIEDPIFAALLPTDQGIAAAAERRRQDQSAASADPKIDGLLRALVNGFERGTLDRSALSSAMSAALTADRLAKLHEQFARLGPLRGLVFHGKTTDGAYDVYEYSATFASGAEAVPLRLVCDAAGKIEGFFQA